MCKYICIYVCIYIYIYILKIDIPSETTFRGNWYIGISFIFLVCEVYGTNYHFPVVCQIRIKALVRNYRMYRKCFWLEKLITVLWHTTIYSAQTSTVSFFLFTSPFTIPTSSFFGGVTQFFCSIITIAVLWQLDNNSTDMNWY